MPRMGRDTFTRVIVVDGAGHYLQLPSLTTAQRNALTGVKGMMIWNSTTSAINQYNGSSWGTVGVSDHGALTGLTDDDHTQYLKEKASGGVASETPTHVHEAAATCGQLDHGAALTGLTDDDHTQYLLGSGGGRECVIVRKAADETVQNNTLHDDDELFFAVGANEVWEFKLFARVMSGTTPDWNYAFTVPSGGTIYSLPAGFDYDTFRTAYDATTALTPTTSGNTTDVFLVQLLYIGGGTAGNVQLQWAQKTTTATDTTVYANSFIVAHRLA